MAEYAAEPTTATVRERSVFLGTAAQAVTPKNLSEEELEVNTRTSAPARSTAGADSRRGHAALFIATATIAVAAIVATGAIWARSDAEPAAPVTSAEVQPARAAPEGPRVAAAPAPASSRLEASQGTTWLYIVRSEEEARRLLETASFVPGEPFQVLVADSTKDAEFAREFNEGLNAVRAQIGQPRLRVVVVDSSSATP